jgi:hypothetical protein
MPINEDRCDFRHMTPTEQIGLLKTSPLYCFSRNEDIRNLANHLLDVARKCDSPLHEQAGLTIQSLLKEKMKYL